MPRATFFPVLLIVALSAHMGFASALPQKSRPRATQAPLVTTVDAILEQIDASLTQLVAMQEDGHWSDARTTAAAILALSGEGSTLSKGPHSGSVRGAVQWLSKQINPKTGLLIHTGPYDDMTHAWVMSAIADIAHLDRSTVGKTFTKRLVKGALGLQQESGLWGQDKAVVETTAQMLLALNIAKKTGVDVADEAIERALSALDQITDAKTGKVTAFKRATAIDTTQATSAVVMAKLLNGRLPAADKLLAKSLDLLEKELNEKSRSIKLYLKISDLEFWRWTTLCRAQMGDDKAWRWTGFQRAAAAAIAAKEGSSEEPAKALALSTMIFGAAYRYETVMEK
ncbi:MAG: hypothetical protein ACJAQ3_003774 [Planctomycetota bacterium]|jgi:hypothetical protein